METFPKDPFKAVKARIVSGDERQVMGVLVGGRGIVVVEPLFLDERDWVTPGGVGSVRVEV